MNKTIKIIWIVVIIIALCSVEAALIRAFTGEKPMVEVYVAVGDIESNQVITKDMLILKNYPSDCIPPFVLQDKESIIGRSALVGIKKGEIVSSTRVSEKVRPGAPQKGKCLFSLKPSPENALAWQIDKGDLVSVIGVAKGGLYEEKNTLHLENIAVNSIINSTYKPDADNPLYVLLEVTPEQAKDLAVFRLSGELIILGQD